MNLPHEDPRAPLHGIRVLDLTRLLPGPMASLALADLGARIDKLEDPGPGDYLRHMEPQRDGMSGAYRVLNRDKRALLLDLKHPRGSETLLRMLPHYDVLLESFRPGVLARLGLSYERMLEVNPRLIVCAITGYGQDGPLALRAGHDLDYLARAGVLGATGPAEGPPAVHGAQMADVAGGALWAVGAISAALFARERTGKGRVLDISMTEGSIPLAIFSFGAFVSDGNVPPRGAHYLNGGIAPYQTYATKDGGHVALGALEPKFWEKFCRANGMEASLEALLPGPHQAEWKEKLQALFLTRTADEWEAFNAQHDCCVEPVRVGTSLVNDPQHQARGTFFDLGGIPHVRTPLGQRDVAHTEARTPGADTKQVLSEAGFSAEEITALVSEGVLG